MRHFREDEPTEIGGKRVLAVSDYKESLRRYHDGRQERITLFRSAVDVTLPGGEKRRAMLNIGVRPTVDDSDRPEVTIEAHIIDWSGDLYGQPLTIEFLSRLRDELRFDDLDSLKRQLEKDKALAMGEGCGVSGI